MPIRMVLASASPARRRLLQRAGVDPQVVVSGVDEAAIVEAETRTRGALTPAQTAQFLARAKCEEVVERLVAAPPHAASPGRPDLVLGCDSVLDVDGHPVGKPADPAEAVTRWTYLSGRQATLVTGHWLVDLREAPGAGGERVRPLAPGLGATAATRVRFGRLTRDDIAAYVATGEPLSVAGGFTIDGLGGPFIDGVEGDPHNVVGLSLPVLRGLVEHFGLRWPQLWSPRH